MANSIEEVADGFNARTPPHVHFWERRQARRGVTPAQWRRVCRGRKLAGRIPRCARDDIGAHPSDAARPPPRLAWPRVAHRLSECPPPEPPPRSAWLTRDRLLPPIIAGLVMWSVTARGLGPASWAKGSRWHWPRSCCCRRWPTGSPSCRSSSGSASGSAAAWRSAPLASRSTPPPPRCGGAVRGDRRARHRRTCCRGRRCRRIGTVADWGVRFQFGLLAYSFILSWGSCTSTSPPCASARWR